MSTSQEDLIAEKTHTEESAHFFDYLEWDTPSQAPASRAKKSSSKKKTSENKDEPCVDILKHTVQDLQTHASALAQSREELEARVAQIEEQIGQKKDQKTDLKKQIKEVDAMYTQNKWIVGVLKNPEQSVGKSKKRSTKKSS